MIAEGQARLPPSLLGPLRVLRYLALAAALFLLLPVLTHQYELRLANFILIQAIAAIGVNIILGYAGLISVAHAATMAIGAYASVLVMTRLGLPFVPAFFVATLLGGVVSALVGVLGTRVRPNYFLLITVGIHQVTFLVLINEAWLTGGPTGIFGVPDAAIGPLRFGTDREFYGLAVVSFVLGLFLAERLRHSRDGRAMFALRLHESAAAISGVPVARYRVLAMLIAGMYLGAAGSLFAHLVGFLGTESFGLPLALQLTLIVVVGGIGSNVGAALSAAALMLVTEQFRDVGRLWVLFYGLLIMILMVVAPRGLAGFALFARESLRRWTDRIVKRADSTRRGPP